MPVEMIFSGSKAGREEFVIAAVQSNDGLMRQAAESSVRFAGVRTVFSLLLRRWKKEAMPNVTRGDSRMGVVGTARGQKAVRIGRRGKRWRAARICHVWFYISS